MKKFMIWCESHPVFVLIFISFLTIISLFFIRNLKIDPSVESMMIKDDPDYLYYMDTVKKFGVNNILVVFLKDKDLFTQGKLDELNKLQKALNKVPGIIKAESLITAIKLLKGSLIPITDDEVSGAWQTTQKINELKEKLLRNQVLVGNIISKDGMSCAINLFLDSKNNDPNLSIKVSNQVDDILLKWKSSFGNSFQIGIPYIKRQISENIVRDALVMIPLSTCALLITLFIAMRSISGAACLILTAGLSLIWTGGFMGMMGIPLDVLTIIVPSLLIVTGSTEDIHLLSEYFEGIKGTTSRSKAVHYMADKLALAIFFTSAANFLAFFSITFNKIVALKNFGITSSFGLLASSIATFMVMPVYLRYFGPNAAPVSETKEIPFLERCYIIVEKTIFMAMEKNKWIIFWSLIGSSFIVWIFTTRIEIDNDQLSFFRSRSEIKLRSQIMHEEIAGAQVFFIRISSGFQDAFKQPEHILEIAKMQNYIKNNGWFDKTLSIADVISAIHKEQSEDESKDYLIPDSLEQVKIYFSLIPEEEILPLITKDASEVNIIVRHNISSSYKLNNVMAQLNQYLSKNLNPHFRFGITGETILINKAADSMAQGQFQSFMCVAFTLFILMSVLFVNIKAGFLSLVPNLFPVFIFYGLLGLLKIPLNIGTSMISVISLGIAMDDTVLLMTRYNKEMRVLQCQKKAMEITIHSELGPIVSSHFALVLGFSVLAFSSFVPAMQFGLFSALVVILAMICGLYLTPIILSSFQFITLWDMLSLDLKEGVIKRSKLFKDLKTWEIKKVVLLGRELTKGKGELAILAGEPGTSIYLLLEGQAQAIAKKKKQGTEVVISQLVPGDVFGISGFVEHRNRFVDVIALEPIKYLEIDWNSMKRLQRIYPRTAARMFLNLAQIMSHRLEATSANLLQVASVLEYEIENSLAQNRIS